MDCTNRYFSDFNGALEELDQLFPMPTRNSNNAGPASGASEMTAAGNGRAALRAANCSP